MANLGDQIVQLFGQDSGEPGGPDTLNKVVQGGTDFLNAIKPDFGAMAHQGLNEFADAISGEDAQGNHVPNYTREMTLFGNALPSGIAAKGAIGAAEQMERLVPRVEKAATHVDQVPFQPKEIPAVNSRDVYGMEGEGFLTPKLEKDFGLSSSITNKPRTAVDLSDGMRKIAELTGLPEDALGLRGKLNLYGDVGLDRINDAAGIFQPNNSTIALGEGYHNALGHEYGHALDNYFGRYFSPAAHTAVAGEDVGKLGDSMYSMRHMASSDPTNMRPALEDKFENLMSVLRDPEYTKASMKGDFMHDMKTGQMIGTQNYLQHPAEKLARAFEYYLFLKNGGQDLPGLTAVNAIRKAAHENFGSIQHPEYPLPYGREQDLVKAFDEFFNEVKTRTAVRDDGRQVTEMYTGANPTNAPTKKDEQK